MSKYGETLFVLGLLLFVFGSVGVAVAQEGEEEEEIGWFNSTELSLVVTDGNSSTETFGFQNTLRREWSRARYTLRLDGVRSNAADDRFALVDPDASGGFRVIEPPTEPDVERYLIENRYEREITERFFWNVGLSWDRNLDAGILNRYQAYVGVGNIWWDRKDLKFNTSYGVSYTDREEESPDPAKDDRFGGFRFNWHYLNKFGANTTYENDWSFNTNFKDTSDYFTEMVNSIAVAINTRVALKVSLQWVYSNEPALEEIDLLDETGDLVGEVSVRKERLDTIFRTALVVNF
jgi:hypothetical protein